MKHLVPIVAATVAATSLILGVQVVKNSPNIEEISYSQLTGNIVSETNMKRISTDNSIRVSGHDIIAPQDAKVFTEDGQPSGKSNLSSGTYIVSQTNRSVLVRIP